MAVKTNISVLGITETKLDDTINNEEIKIDGYNLLRSDRNRNGGGVACYIKNNIAYNRKPSLSENIENVTLDILLPKSKPITVGIIYRPPSQNDFVEHFHKALTKLPFQSNEIFLLGDFNINLFFEGHFILKKYFRKLKEAQSKQSLLKPYLETLLTFGLNQIIDKSTRSTLNTSTLIDHILTNSNIKEKISHQGVISTGMSDHDFIFCIRKTKANKSGTHNTISIRTYKRYSKGLLLDKINQKELPNYSTFESIDDAYNNLTAALQDIVNDITPVKDIRVKGNTKPWFDNSIIDAIRVRDKLKERFLRTNLHVDHERFKEQQLLVKKKIKKKKTSFVIDQLQRNSKQPKELWKVLKKIGMPSKKSQSSKICLKEGNVIQFDDKKMQTLLKTFTQSLLQT